MKREIEAVVLKVSFTITRTDNEKIKSYIEGLCSLV